MTSPNSQQPSMKSAWKNIRTPTKKSFTQKPEHHPGQTGSSTAGMYRGTWYRVPELEVMSLKYGSHHVYIRHQANDDYWTTSIPWTSARDTESQTWIVYIQASFRWRT